MDNIQELTQQEEEELREGQDFFEMMQTPGFKRLQKLYEDMAYHTWIDPREIESADAKKEWDWRELNAFHAANNAREILEKLQQAISRAEYLEKRKSGEIKIERMKI